MSNVLKWKSLFKAFLKVASRYFFPLFSKGNNSWTFRVLLCWIISSCYLVRVLMRYALSQNASNYKHFPPVHVRWIMLWNLFPSDILLIVIVIFVKISSLTSTVFYPTHYNFLSFIFHEHLSNCHFCGFFVVVCFVLSIHHYVDPFILGQNILLFLKLLF